MNRADAIQNGLCALSCVMLHGVLTSPEPNGFNPSLVRDAWGVVASVPRVLDAVTVKVDRVNEDVFGYGATSAMDACTLKSEPRPDPISLAQYQQFNQVGSSKTVAEVSAMLGQPLCYTYTGSERRIVQGNTERRILDIRYDPLGKVQDATLTQAN